MMDEHDDGVDGGFDVSVSEGNSISIVFLFFFSKSVIF